MKKKEHIFQCLFRYCLRSLIAIIALLLVLVAAILSLPFVTSEKVWTFSGRM